jgi:hypothetical protein
LLVLVLVLVLVLAMTDDCNANGTRARLDALTRMLDVRDDHNRERYEHLKELLDRFISTTDDKFHASNEWRGALNDRTQEGVSRKEYNIQHSSLEGKISDLSGLTKLIMGIGFGLNAAVIIAIGLLSIFLRH